MWALLGQTNSHSDSVCGIEDIKIDEMITKCFRVYTVLVAAVLKSEVAWGGIGSGEMPNNLWNTRGETVHIQDKTLPQLLIRLHHTTTLFSSYQNF
jgi:hypothetical protein